MPSIADIAKLAGVSTWTVSIALRDLPGVTPDTRSHIKAIAEALHYVPRRRKLVPSETLTLVGIITHRDIGPFVTDILQGAITEAYYNRVHLVIFQVDREDPFHYSMAIRDLIATGVKGIVLVNGKTEPLPHNLLMAMWSGGVHPVVVQNAYFSTPTDRVMLDLPASFALAAGQLADQGHREVACLTHPGAETYLSLLANALNELGISLTTSRSVVEMCDIPELVAELLRGPRFTALCLQDFWYWHVVSTLKDFNMRVPEDVSLVGLARVYWGRFASDLTTVEQNPRQIGSRAIALLRQRLNDGIHPTEVEPREVLVAPELIIRASCAPPPALAPGRP